jgi:hypothetical protein
LWPSPAIEETRARIDGFGGDLLVDVDHDLNRKQMRENIAAQRKKGEGRGANKEGECILTSFSTLLCLNTSRAVAISPPPPMKTY